MQITTKLSVDEQIERARRIVGTDFSFSPFRYVGEGFRIFGKGFGTFVGYTVLASLLGFVAVVAIYIVFALAMSIVMASGLLAFSATDFQDPAMLVLLVPVLIVIYLALFGAIFSVVMPLALGPYFAADKIASGKPYSLGAMFSGFQYIGTMLRLALFQLAVSLVVGVVVMAPFGVLSSQAAQDLSGDGGELLALVGPLFILLYYGGLLAVSAVMVYMYLSGLFVSWRFKDMIAVTRHIMRKSFLKQLVFALVYYLVGYGGYVAFSVWMVVRFGAFASGLDTDMGPQTPDPDEMLGLFGEMAAFGSLVMLLFVFTGPLMCCVQYAGFRHIVDQADVEGESLVDRIGAEEEELED